MKDKYRVIYKPRGAALEYSELAVNLYVGCLHGCKYCYAPGCMHKAKEEYHTSPTVRKNILNQLQSDLTEMSMSKDKRRVLMCFITDPYQGDYEFNHITSEALAMFKAYNIPVQVLTKGGMKAARDFHLYKKSDAYAVTLTFDNEKDSKAWEPNAALPAERIKSLRKAKEKGIETWVSLEPVIIPEQALAIIDQTKDFVDLFKVGKINHFDTGIEVDWRKFAFNVVDKLEGYGKKYYIKDSLTPYL